MQSVTVEVKSAPQNELTGSSGRCSETDMPSCPLCKWAAEDRAIDPPRIPPQVAGPGVGRGSPLCRPAGGGLLGQGGLCHFQDHPCVTSFMLLKDNTQA